MRIQILTVDGGTVTIDNMPDGDVADLLDEIDHATSRLTFTLDDSGDTVHVMAAHITRIDIGPTRKPTLRERITRAVGR